MCCGQLQEKLSINWIKPNPLVTDRVKKGQACLHDKMHDCAGTTACFYEIGYWPPQSENCIIYPFTESFYLYLCEKEVHPQGNYVFVCVFMRLHGSKVKKKEKDAARFHLF